MKLALVQTTGAVVESYPFSAGSARSLAAMRSTKVLTLAAADRPSRCMTWMGKCPGSNSLKRVFNLSLIHI